jgi:hypothetical protein
LSTLNELSQELISLEWQLDWAETEDERQLLVDQYLAAEGSAAKKVDGYASLINELEARAEFRKKEAARPSNRAKQDDNTANFLRDRLIGYFGCHNITTMETPRLELPPEMLGELFHWSCQLMQKVCRNNIGGWR